MKTKEQLRKDLELKYEKDCEIIDIEAQINHLCGYKHICDFVHGYGACFYAKTVGEIKAIIQFFTPSKSEFIQEYRSEKHVVHSPYKISTESNVNGVIVASIEFESELVNVWIKFPASLIERELSFSARGVTDCEYHYFGGTGRSELGKIRVPRADFKSTSLSFFGGYYVLIDAEAADRIVSTLCE